MIKLLLTLLVGCLFITSCKEEQIDPIVEPPISAELKTEVDPCNGYPPQHLVTDFNYLGHVFCTWPCMNCYYAVSIAPKDELYRVYQSFMYSFENNQLSGFFNTQNWELIFPDLDQSVLNKILTGEYKLLIRDSSSDSNTKMFIIMKANGDESLLSDDDIIVVLQIKFV